MVTTNTVPPRQRILAAADDLFRRQGIRGVGVEAIAEAAGTNKMTLYRHFDSKDELVAEWLRGIIAEKDKAWDEIIAEHPDDPVGQLVDWSRRVAENFAEIVHQAGQHHPPGMPVAADRLGGLEAVLDLREIGIGVALVHQGVEVVEGLPDAHLGPGAAGVLALFIEDKLARLVGVVETIEFAHSRRGGVIVFTKIFRLAVRVVPLLYEVIPLFQRIECFHVYQDVVTQPSRGWRV